MSARIHYTPIIVLLIQPTLLMRYLILINNLLLKLHLFLLGVLR